MSGRVNISVGYGLAPKVERMADPAVLARIGDQVQVVKASEEHAARAEG